MKTRLLAVVQSERQRALAPAVVEVQRRRVACENPNPSFVRRTATRAKSVLGVVYHAYRFVTDVASLPSGDVVLPMTGHKYDEVYEELTAAGLPVQRIATRPSPRQASLQLTLHLRALSALLRALFVTAPAWKSARLRPYAEVLLLTEALVQILRARKHCQYWVIIGDLTTTLIALASACHETGQRVISWQYSYLDFKRFPVRGYAAVVLNEDGLVLARHESDPVGLRRVYWRPGKPVAPLRLEGLEHGPIGALLNVHADRDAIARLDALRQVLGQSIHVRLHPNSSLAGMHFPEGLVLADPTEPLDDFAARISLAISGNTQAQAKALCLGTPVIQCAGLDILPFDHHGYVRDGIVAGIQDVAEFSFDRIRAFYSERGYVDALRKLLGPEPQNRVPGLDGLVRDLA